MLNRHLRKNLHGEKRFSLPRQIDSGSFHADKCQCRMSNQSHTTVLKAVLANIAYATGPKTCIPCHSNKLTKKTQLKMSRLGLMDLS